MSIHLFEGNNHKENTANEHYSHCQHYECMDVVIANRSMQWYASDVIKQITGCEEAWDNNNEN